MLKFFGRLAGFAPADGREAPEPGGSPRVEHVGVLLPVGGVGRGGEGDVEVLRIVAVGALAVPDGDAVAPPELTADAPVLDVFQPVQVGLRPAFGVKLDDTRRDGPLGFVDFRVADEPLFAEARFDRYVGALGVTYRILVGLGLYQGAEFFEEFFGYSAGLEAFDAGERACVGVHRAVGVHHIDYRQIMALADIEVGAVVGWGHLQDACTKFFLNRGIADDRDLGAREGPPDVFTDEVLVAFVFRVDGDGGVARDRLGARGGDLEERARNLGHLVAHTVE